MDSVIWKIHLCYFPLSKSFAARELVHCLYCHAFLACSFSKQCLTFITQSQVLTTPRNNALKTFWEKEKVLVTSMFSSQNVLYPIKNRFQLLGLLSSANAYNLDRSKILLSLKRLMNQITMLLYIISKKLRESREWKNGNWILQIFKHKCTVCMYIEIGFISHIHYCEHFQQFHPIYTKEL